MDARSPAANDTLARLAAVIDERRAADPAASRAIAKGPDAVLKKSARRRPGRHGVQGRGAGRWKVADLWFHTMIARRALAPSECWPSSSGAKASRGSRNSPPAR
jgi:phosphoribosyl-ATP pyrophosphohydrolase